MSFDIKSLRSDERTVFELRDLYRRYGYSRFKMSKFEEYDLYIRNKDFLVSDRMITFTDAGGRLLALKPDVTISILKNTKQGDGGLRKVYYNETVYRTVKGDAAFREIMQTGLECIGELDAYHVFEVISLAVKSLQAISGDYVLDLSHMGLVLGLMETAGVPEEGYSKVLAAVREKNAAELERVCDELKLSSASSALLNKLISVYGRLEEVLPALAPFCYGEKTRKAWEELNVLSGLLKGNGLGERVQIDFSVVNDMSYYTGIVFQGFIKGLSAGVLSGGQYDKLAQRMGDLPGAIGFAIYLDELERLNSQEAGYDTDVLLLYNEDTELSLLTKTIAGLAEEGKRVLARQEITETLRYREMVDLRIKEA